MGDFPNDADLPAFELAVTDACNNRCQFCTTGWVNAESKEPIDHVSAYILRERMIEAFEKGARRIVLHGGEPTLRRDLDELCRYARELGYQRVSIFTHGRTAASRAGADWLAGLGVDWFHVSVQAGTAAAHDAAVAAPAFDQTIAGLRNLLRRGQRVKVNGVLTRWMLDTLPDFARLMCELLPEEVGLDAVKPTNAFLDGRAAYAGMIPALAPYAPALRDAILAMNEAGITAFLTSFPPCLVPGAEHYVSEEPASTLGISYIGLRQHKLTWRRSLMVKREECRACAYDETCCGVYTNYAEAHGLDELRPIAERRPIPKVVKVAREQETPITRALKALFLRADQNSVVRRVRRLADGTHELGCATPSGELAIVIGPRNVGAAYAKTDLFSVRFHAAPGAPPPDPRLLDAVVRRLRLAEAYLNQAS